LSDWAAVSGGHSIYVVTRLVTEQQGVGDQSSTRDQYVEPEAAVPLRRVEPEAAGTCSGRFVAPPGRPTGKSSERSSWHLLGHGSGSAAVLAAGTSQAIGKRLSRRLNGTSVAPGFTPKRNSELSDNRGRRPHDAVRLEIGEKHVAAEAHASHVPSCSRG